MTERKKEAELAMAAVAVAVETGIVAMQMQALEVQGSQRCQYMVVAKDVIKAGELLVVGDLIKNFFKQHGVKEGLQSKQFAMYNRETADGNAAIVVRTPKELVKEFEKFLKEKGMKLEKILVAEARKILGKLELLAKEKELNKSDKELKSDKEDSARPKAAATR